MRALLSVWDKTGIVDVARRLHNAGYELISTGGTFKALEEAELPVRAVSDVTGSPEMIGGRVKTLHPAIHAGLLARRDQRAQLDEIAQHGIELIDLVIANLYPFGEAIQQSDMPIDEALEYIDIGGPTMIRAAAKNFPAVLVLVDPDDYQQVVEEIEESGPDNIPLERRRGLAAKAFAHVSAYDSVIAAYLRPQGVFPDQLPIAGQKMADVRYGENPHQQAAIYRVLKPEGAQGVATWSLLGGKDMSYNNYLDASAAWEAASSFGDPTVAIIKHMMPCGVASHADLTVAYELALQSDPVSAFGGVIAINSLVDSKTAGRIAERFYEVVLAPGFTEGAMEALRRRKNLRIVEVPTPSQQDDMEIRTLDGVFLVQTPDRGAAYAGTWRPVTDRNPSDKELEGLAFAWRVVRHVKSNAIVLANGRATVGIGGGQPNRVDAVRIAIERAGDRATDSIMASDAFFPFPDSVEVAAAAGVTAIVQPGGGLRDEEVIDAANRAGIAMVLTGVRHFRH